MTDEDAPDTGRIVIPYAPRPWQWQVHQRLKRFNVLVVHRGAGKDLSLDTLIPTPDGFTTMGEIQVGDTVFDRDGQPCQVTGVSEIFNHDCYEVEFSSGERFVAGGNHQWLTQTIQERQNEKYRKNPRRRVENPKNTNNPRGNFTGAIEGVRTTLEIMQSLEEAYLPKHSCRQRNHRVHLTPPIAFEAKALPLHPYVLGYWLGDGTSAASAITVGISDQEAFVSRMMQVGVAVKQRDPTLFHIGPNGHHYPDLCYMKIFRSLDLIKNKHIPECYLRSSVEDRWQLLQGLMDSDGYTDDKGKCEYTTIRQELAEDVHELLCSLGIRPHIICRKRCSINGMRKRDAYRIGFQAFADQPIFSLPRKQARLQERKKYDLQRSRMIVAVRPVESVSTKCIEVNSPTHTYCIGRAFIPTHNSYLCMNELIRKALSGPQYAEYAYILPLRNQAQRNVWEPFKRLIAPLPDLKLNNATLEATFPNGAKIMILGADDPEKLRGLHLHGVILDEFADMHPNTWRAVRPMLTNHAGWCIWIGTPKGHNEFYRKFMQSQEVNRPTWYGQLLPWWKTNALPRSEIDQMRSEMLPEEFAQELECFPPGSLVGTGDDLIPIERLQAGDLVLTHAGRLRRIKQTMQKHFDGELLNIQAWGSKGLRLTPEHPVRVCDPSSQTYDWVAAKDLKPGDWLVIPKKWKGLPLIAESLAELIAWYVSEGSVSQNVISISLGSHEKSFISRVQDCFTALGRESKIKIQDSCTVVWCCDVALGDFLVRHCGNGAPHKRLPLAMLTGHERLVFDTLIDGDGHIRQLDRVGKPRPVWMYSTVSETLVQQVQLLAASLDMGGTYTTKPAGQTIIEDRICNTRESYCLQLTTSLYYEDKRPEARIRFAKNGILCRVHAITAESYSGPVYNLHVAEDESYTVNNLAVHNCSFEAALVGSYYGKHLADLRDNGRISSEKLYRPDLEVHTAWDLGIRDRMAVWFFQLVGDDIHFIDYEEHSNYGFPEWIDILTMKSRNYGYHYGTHIAPHDIKNRELGSGISRLESAEQLGLHFEQCPKQDVMDGIELVRRHFPRFRFHSIACEEGIEALTMYKAKTDKMGQGLGPEHSIFSHAADSLKYAVTHVVQVMTQPRLTRMPMLRRR